MYEVLICDIFYGVIERVLDLNLNRFGFIVKFLFFIFLIWVNCLFMLSFSFYIYIVGYLICKIIFKIKLLYLVVKLYFNRVGGKKDLSCVMNLKV